MSIRDTKLGSSVNSANSIKIKKTKTSPSYSISAFISITRKEGLGYLRRYNQKILSSMRSGNTLDEGRNVSVNDFPWNPDEKCVLFVGFRGDLTGLANHEFSLQLSRISDPGVKAMILDLRKVNLICSELIRTLTQWASRSESSIEDANNPGAKLIKTPIACYGASKNLTLTLKTFGFDNTCPLLETIDDAKYYVFTRKLK